MTYVDAYYDRIRDRINIAERVNGERILRTEPCQHTFYYSHPAGGSKTIFGQTCRKYTHRDHRKFMRELKSRRDAGHDIFESDIRPEFRFLADNYMGADAPILNVGFFDIEADFHPTKGYAPVEDPFNAITAISVHLSEINSLICLALRPPTLSIEEAREIGSKFENTVVFDDEGDLLRAFLDVTENVDCYVGWNSEGYDIPYTVNRIKRVLGDDEAKRLCLWGQSPRLREYLKFGKPAITYDLVGKVHMDYLLLYQKHNPQQLHSYRLDYVAEIEVGDNKVPYEGTLDDLYKNDFEKFIDYNRQDVDLMVKIDAKKKFLDLANQIAHANCVTLKTTMGSVALVEQAIINEMHEMGFVVPDRKDRSEDGEYSEPLMDDFGFEISEDDEYAPEVSDERTPVVGAYVAKPKTGIHRQVACMDINSLYPSVLRALNMSPETIVGQVRPDRTMALVEERIAAKVPRAEAWEGIFTTLEVGSIIEQTNEIVTVDMDDGQTFECTGAELYQMIFGENSGLCITANGTIFRTDKEGIIPQLLAKWYAERKSMQAKEAAFGKMAEGVAVPDDLLAMLQ